MLKIQNSSRPSQKCTPNLLPARIDYNGAIATPERYWKPETDEKGETTVHFRGRKLTSDVLPLPENYTGAILQVTDRVENRTALDTRLEEEEEEEEEEKVETKIVEQVGAFEKVVVWQHGGRLEGTEDPYAKGIGEWIAFAEAIHGNDE
ncbi:ribonuclease H1 small subunit [Delitschia confertaspora ATCC 74209]|uniref:Ribonuclease H1 small subunit n=1 Tax=Delitschia confertaspora ATCC 74209 TaxID=1513339 RepID=A0A9P4JG14_9PLEO|nr:ribonuclease H1 small subunit [Delitschia confertaspora ATCC 74209]